MHGGIHPRSNAPPGIRRGPIGRFLAGAGSASSVVNWEGRKCSMPRFCKNRCCSFILAFLIGVAGLSVGPASVRAFGVLDDGTSTPGGGVPPSVGDPDEPSGSGRTGDRGTLR